MSRRTDQTMPFFFFLFESGQVNWTIWSRQSLFLVGEFCRAKDSEILSLRGAKEFLDKL